MKSKANNLVYRVFPASGKEDQMTDFKKKTAPRGTVLSGGFRLDGEIRFQNALTVDCSLNCDIHSETGDLIITEQGRLNGKIQANRIYLKGTIESSDPVQCIKAYLLSKSVLHADLHAGSLYVEEGAELEGDCLIESEQGENHE